MTTVFITKRTYTSTQTVELDETFRCAHCGFTSPVKVSAEGLGYTEKPGLARDERLGKQAVELAVANAEEYAKLYLSLRSCPKCGRADEAATANHRNRAKKAILIGAAVSIAAIVTLGLSLALGGQVWLKIAGGTATLCGAVWLILVPLSARNAIAQAQTRVRFPVST